MNFFTKKIIISVCGGVADSICTEDSVEDSEDSVLRIQFWRGFSFRGFSFRELSIRGFRIQRIQWKLEDSGFKGFSES